jgi:DNA polymerase III epsilon subunit-like protein
MMNSILKMKMISINGFVRFLDTETTGAGEEDRIIQLGFMVLEGKKVDVYNDLCSAPLPIGYGAMEVHGITPEMIEGKPSVHRDRSV